MPGHSESRDFPRKRRLKKIPVLPSKQKQGLMQEKPHQTL